MPVLSFYESQLANGATHIYCLNDPAGGSGSVAYDTGNGPRLNAFYGGATIAPHQSIAANCPGLVGDQTVCLGVGNADNVSYPTLHDPNGTGSFTVEFLGYITECNNNDARFLLVNDATDETGRGLTLGFTNDGAFECFFTIGGPIANVGVSFSPSGSTLLNRCFYMSAGYDASTGAVFLAYWDAVNGSFLSTGSGALYKAAANALELNGNGSEPYGDGYSGRGFFSSYAIYDFMLTPAQVAQNIANIPNDPADPFTNVLSASLSIHGGQLVLTPVDAMLPYEDTQAYIVRYVAPNGDVSIPTGVFMTTAGRMVPDGITSGGTATLYPDPKVGTYTVSFVEL